MASVHEQGNNGGRSWRVKWRAPDGKQTSASFADKAAADRFKTNIDDFGADEALRILKVEETNDASMTVTDYLLEYIDSLTGVQAATAERYRRYLSRDITPVFGSLPLTAVTESTIGRWVQKMEETKDRRGNLPSAKTLQNKHGFVSGAFKVAARKRLIDSNPCDGRRLPEGQEQEMVCLTPAEFQLMHDCLPAQWQRNLATWLVSTGMRFSEATALTAADIDATKRTCRVNKAWKYSGDYRPKIGPPKTKRSNRTITLSQVAMDAIDLTCPEWLFTNGVGNPVRAQEFFNNGWKLAREKAQVLGLEKSPRVHDLRHTHASWLINAGTPLPVVQARLGHENISTTIQMYYHVDQRAEQQAAAMIEHLLTSPPHSALDP